VSYRSSYSGQAAGWRSRIHVSVSGKGRRHCSSPQHAYWLGWPFGLLFGDCQWFFTGGLSGRAVKLTTLQPSTADVKNIWSHTPSSSCLQALRKDRFVFFYT
jgi:hypothetical protein